MRRHNVLSRKLQLARCRKRPQRYGVRIVIGFGDTAQAEALTYKSAFR